MTVIASDKGDPVLTNSATIMIQVDDVNEFAPQFSMANYSHTTVNVSIGKSFEFFYSHSYSYIFYPLLHVQLYMYECM